MILKSKGKIMGCHTWCYRRVGKWEELVKDINFVKIIEKEIFSYIDFKYKWISKDGVEELKGGFRYLKFLNRLRKLLEKGYLKNSEKFKEFILDLIYRFDDDFKKKFKSDFIIYKNGYVYEEIKEYGDNLFRLPTYDVELTSYEETLKHLEKYYDPNNIYRGSKLNMDLVKEFWKKYPDGLIRLS